MGAWKATETARPGSLLGTACMAACAVALFATGCSSFKKVQTTVQCPPRHADKLGEIQSLAILGFTYPTEPRFAIEMLDTFLKRLVDARTAFKIVERSGLEEIRNEIARAHSIEFDESLRARVGKLVSSTHVLFGTVESLEVYDTTEMRWSELTERDAGYYSGDSLPPKEVVRADRTSQIRVAEITMSYRVVEVETGTVLFAEKVAEVYSSRSSLVGPPPSKAELKRRLVDRVSERLLHNFVSYPAARVALVACVDGLSRGNKMLAMGLAPEALEHYRGVAESINSPYAHYNTGVAHEMLGDYEQAEEAYRRAVAGNPDEEVFAGALGRVRRALGPR